MLTKIMGLAKYWKYVGLLLDVAAAVSEARKGQSFGVQGSYSVEGKVVDVDITGKVRN